MYMAYDKERLGYLPVVIELDYMASRPGLMY